MPVVEGNTAITATGEGMEDSTVSENPCTFVRPSSGPGRSSFCPGSRTGAAEGRRIPYPMVHGMKKSDEAGVPMKAANKGAKAPAELPVGKGLNQGEFARPKHVPDAGSGGRVTGGRADTASCNEKAAGETDCALAPHHHGRAAVRLLRLEEDRIGWRGRGTRTDWKSGCSTCTDAYIRERIGRCRRDGLKYPNRTAGRDRSALPPWKTTPRGGQQPLLLEAVERRIQRTLLDDQRAARDLLDAQQHAVPVEGSERDGLENQDVERPGQQRGARRHDSPKSVRKA